MGFFKLKSPDAIYEAFDEEIVAVNLETGNYFSITGTGPQIWIDLVDGYSIPEIVHRIRERHIGDAGEIGVLVDAFAGELVKCDLLAPSDSAGPRSAPPIPPVSQKTPFSAPTIDSYDDMRDLLMLDPIHDVDDTGWPSPKNSP